MSRETAPQLISELPTDKTERRFGRKTRLAASLALAAALAGGLTACGDKVDAAPANTPSATVEATPSATPTPEVEAPEEMIEAFMGTEVPESIYTDTSEMPTDILKGALYETLTPDEQARVDTWHSAIYIDGTFLELPVEERIAAAAYTFAANSAGANARFKNPDHAYIRDAQEKMGTPSLDNTPLQARLQVEMYQAMAGQLAIDSDSSDETIAPIFDKTLAAAILSGLMVNPELQIASAERMNNTTAYINFPTEQIFEREIISATKDGNIISVTVADDGGTRNTDYELIQFTDIHGEVHSAWTIN